MKLSELWDKIQALFKGAMDEETPEEARAIKDVDSWDGSAAQYASTEEYCGAALIDVNSAAGRDTKAQDHCMLPVRGPGDSADTYVRQGVHGAAQRFGQVKKPDDVPQADWDKAVKAAAGKLISAYGQMDEAAPDSLYEAAGKTKPERAVGMQQVWEQLYLSLDTRNQATGGYSWPVDIYSDAGELYAVVAEGGRLYRVALAVTGSTLTPGEWTEVVVEHTPAERTVVSRQADGSYRWLGISATSVLNHVGEIDSRDLFDRFVERAASGEFPQRDFYHLEDAALVGRCDFLARDGNVLISSGVYYDTPIAQAVRRATEAGETNGDSISYEPSGPAELVEVADGVKLPVYRDGVLKFISALPQDRAASLFTATRAVREVNRMRDEVKLALLGLKEHGLDDDTINAIIGQVDSANRAIDEGGLITRGAPPAESTPAPTTTVVNVAPAPVELVLDDAALAEVARTVFDSESWQQMIGLRAEVDELKAALEAANVRAANAEQVVAERLVKLERADDDKRREWVADLPRQTQRVTYRPREAHAADEDELDSEAIAQATLSKVPGRY
jgi:hypothetical protein